MTLLEAIIALVAQAMNVLLLVMVVMIPMNVQLLYVGKNRVQLNVSTGNRTKSQLTQLFKKDILQLEIKKIYIAI